MIRADPMPRLRPGRLPIVVLLVACFISAGLAGGATYFIAGRGRKAKAAKKTKKPPPKVTFTHTLGEVLVNLADTDQQRFCKATIVVGVDNIKLKDGMEDKTPILRDVVITELSRHTLAELHNPEGVEALKNDLRIKLSKALEGGNVLQVYLDGFVMQ